MVVLPDGTPRGGNGVGYSYLTHGVAVVVILDWSRSRSWSSSQMWITLDAGSQNENSGNAHNTYGVAR